MLGLPYMGSKRKLAPKIINHILSQNPNCKYFYDLMGGGGAMSFAALRNKKIKQVFYNEIDPAITSLLTKLQNEGVTDEFYKWVDRETFHANKKGNDWFAGLVKTVWSFGNKGKDYLYGENIEEMKRLAHEVVVNRCEESRGKLDIPTILFSLNTITKRRLFLKKCIKDKMGTLIQCLQNLQHLGGLQCLEYLQFHSLNISNLSYENVAISTPIEETVIYCDPPYESTEEYTHKFDHQKFKEWVKNSSYKVYVSSYKFEGLPCVLEMEHRSTLSATNNSKQVTERLFCNREEKLINQISLF